MTIETSDDFDFESGDRVLVRAQGDNGTLVAKFVGECVGFRAGFGPGSDTARIRLDAGSSNYVTLKSYDAEFETVDGTVNF